MMIEYKINNKSLVSEDYSITVKQDQNFVSDDSGITGASAPLPDILRLLGRHTTVHTILVPTGSNEKRLPMAAFFRLWTRRNYLLSVGDSMQVSPANKRCHSPDGELWFCFLFPYESKLSTVTKNKTTSRWKWQRLLDREPGGIIRYPHADPQPAHEIVHFVH